MTAPDTRLYTPEDPRLGRHVFHDPRNRDYDVRALLLDEEPPRQLVLWGRRGPVFDQGACPPDVLADLGADPADRSIGCCTAAAAFGLLNTEPYAKTGPRCPGCGRPPTPARPGCTSCGCCASCG